MPTYAYACRDCDHAFDIHQAFSDDSLTVCPSCEGSLRKKFNSVGVVFKGSGFYRNDSRDSKKSIDVGTGGSGTSTSSSDSSAGVSEGGSSTPAAAKEAAPAVKKPTPTTKTTAAAS